MAIDIANYTLHSYPDGRRCLIDFDGGYVDLTNKKIQTSLFTIFVHKNKFLIAEDLNGFFYDLTDIKNLDPDILTITMLIYYSTRNRFAFCKKCEKILLKEISHLSEELLKSEEYYSGNAYCLKCTEELLE